MNRGLTRREWATLGFALLLLVTSLVPLPESGGQQVPALLGVELDKWVHALGYATLASLLAWARSARAFVAVAAAVLVATVYGAGIELLQGLVASRSTSVLDFAANSIGAILAGTVWQLRGWFQPE